MNEPSIEEQNKTTTESKPTPIMSKKYKKEKKILEMKMKIRN